MAAKKQEIKISDVEKNIIIPPAYKAKFLSNNKHRNFLTALKKEFEKCSGFCISVAFITDDGINPLLGNFADLMSGNRNVKGRILTTDYLTFTDPKALKRLYQFKNFEIKMYCVKSNHPGFHTKGYIFEEDDMYNLIIGSSNLTQRALKSNKEWNCSLKARKEDEYVSDVLEEFEELWESDATKDYVDFIEEYEAKYNYEKKQRKLKHQEEKQNREAVILEPNLMQKDFISNFIQLKEEGKRKALLVSATGTGKTIASAFALREIQAKRVLFIAHREEILKQAKESYERIFNPKIDMGLVSGNEKNWDCDFVFSTVQTMSKEGSLKRYTKDHFEYIIIDEVHRAGGDSYQTIMDYFNPEFYLGMSATPYRTDGVNIFEMFDYNLAYEITLYDALEKSLLCPFHYFGITDFVAEEDRIEEYDDTYEITSFSSKEYKKTFKKKKKLRDFNLLVSEKRVEYIIKQIEYYSYSGERVKGLVFCSKVDEAKELSELFNKKGYKTKYLSGKHNSETREKTINKLRTNDTEDYLDYIFTVDIFNEGIDIPEINQVVMLRPTKSAIVFVQQLGRGLRRVEDKKYVVIIDFIGNYQNNYMIPIALFGNKSYDKDDIKISFYNGDRMIPGCSTIYFDEISRQRIYHAIDDTNLKKVTFYKKAYRELKNKVGRIPSMIDFETHGAIDVSLILEYSHSYYNFLKAYEPDYDFRMDETQENMLRYVSTFFSKGKRLNEVIAMRYLLDCFKDQVSVEEQDLLTYLKEKFVKLGKPYDQNVEMNLINILTNNFLTGVSNTSFTKSIFIEERHGKWGVSNRFSKALEDAEFYRLVEEVIDFWAYRHQNYYNNKYLNSDFCLYKKYNYDDVFRLLNWDKSHLARNVGGYKYNEKTKSLPIFIDFGESKYNDRFVNDKKLIAISKIKRNLKSKEVRRILNAKQKGIQIDLFVCKTHTGSKEFYYMGEISTVDKVEETKTEYGENVVEFTYILDVPVHKDIYNYLTECNY